MRNSAISRFIITLLFIGFSTFSTADEKYSKIYIFGDSLSDAGNFASLIGSFPPLYYNNRVSNGPLAIDVMAGKLGLSVNASMHLLGLNQGNNYAVAGAKASKNDPIDLNTQIVSFQANHGNIAPADALYVIFIGGNDIRSALMLTSTENAKATINSAVSKIHDIISVLNQIGARTFLIINSLDVAQIPETRLIASATNNPDLIQQAHSLSSFYKKRLHKMIEKAEEEFDINVTEFNLFKYFNKIIKKSEKFGFTNTTDACFSSVTFTFHPDCNYGANFDKFFFFDEIHPSARVHDILGKAFFDAINDDDEHELEDSD